MSKSASRSSKASDSRREIAARYTRGLRGTRLTLPYEPSGYRHVYHLYVIQVENREVVQATLGKENIGTGIHYPIPLHLQKAYTRLGYRPGDLPVSENAAQRILSLPMFPGISEADQVRVVEALVQTGKGAVVQRLTNVSA